MDDQIEHNMLVDDRKFNSNRKQCRNRKGCLTGCHCYGCQMGDIKEHDILRVK